MTPARKAVLDTTLEGPIEKNEPHMLREWRFVQVRKGKHARKFTLTFSPGHRTFSFLAVRRRSKRARRSVAVSKGMRDYLRSRLSPQTIAACMAAALVAEPDDTIPF